MRAFVHFVSIRFDSFRLACVCVCALFVCVCLRVVLFVVVIVLFMEFLCFVSFRFVLFLHEV